MVGHIDFIGGGIDGGTARMREVRLRKFQFGSGVCYSIDYGDAARVVARIADETRLTLIRYVDLVSYLIYCDRNRANPSGNRCRGIGIAIDHCDAAVYARL